MADEWATPEDGERGGYEEIWRFVDQSKPFVFGVETGIIYERMSRREETIISTTHAENEEELRNLANSLDYRAEFQTTGDDEFWQSATFTRER